MKGRFPRSVDIRVDNPTGASKGVCVSEKGTDREVRVSRGSRLFVSQAFGNVLHFTRGMADVGSTAKESNLKSIWILLVRNCAS